MADPRLVDAIRSEAPRHLQLPLLTTALIESSGRLDAVGDNGNSYGPYQENSAGRGSGIAPENRMDPVASTRRAVREFQTFYGRGARGADLAYRAQRPADRSSYVQKYRKALSEAKALLGQGGGSGGAGAASGGGRAQGRQRGGGTRTEVVEGTGGALTGASWRAVMNYLDRSREEVARGAAPTGGIDTALGLKFTGPDTRQVAVPAQGGGGGSGGGRRAAPAGGGAGRAVGSLTYGGGPEGHAARALGNWQSDRAWDLHGKANAPVFFPNLRGTVTKISGSPGGDPGFAGYGVTIDTPQGEFFFKHLGSLGKGVAVGRELAPGDLVGRLDPNTAGGPHLHLGALNQAAGQRIADLYTRGAGRHSYG